MLRQWEKTRLETNMKELMGRTASLEQRTAYVKERLGSTEDRTTWLERSTAFLLQETAKLHLKCDDLESSCAAAAPVDDVIPVDECVESPL